MPENREQYYSGALRRAKKSAQRTAPSAFLDEGKNKYLRLVGAMRDVRRYLIDQRDERHAVGRTKNDVQAAVSLYRDLLVAPANATGDVMRQSLEAYRGGDGLLTERGKHIERAATRAFERHAGADDLSPYIHIVPESQQSALRELYEKSTDKPVTSTKMLVELAAGDGLGEIYKIARDKAIQEKNKAGLTLALPPQNFADPFDKNLLHETERMGFFSGKVRRAERQSQQAEQKQDKEKKKGAVRQKSAVKKSIASMPVMPRAGSSGGSSASMDFSDGRAPTRMPLMSAQGGGERLDSITSSGSMDTEVEREQGKKSEEREEVVATGQQAEDATTRPAAPSVTGGGQDRGDMSPELSLSGQVSEKSPTPQREDSAERPAPREQPQGGAGASGDARSGGKGKEGKGARGEKGGTGATERSSGEQAGGAKKSGRVATPTGGKGKQASGSQIPQASGDEGTEEIRLGGGETSGGGAGDTSAESLVEPKGPGQSVAVPMREEGDTPENRQPTDRESQGEGETQERDGMARPEDKGASRDAGKKTDEREEGARNVVEKIPLAIRPDEVFGDKKFEVSVDADTSDYLDTVSAMRDVQEYAQQQNEGGTDEAKTVSDISTARQLRSALDAAPDDVAKREGEKQKILQPYRQDDGALSQRGANIESVVDAGKDAGAEQSDLSQYVGLLPEDQRVALKKLHKNATGKSVLSLQQMVGMAVGDGLEDLFKELLAKAKQAHGKGTVRLPLPPEKMLASFAQNLLAAMGDKANKGGGGDGQSITAPTAAADGPSPKGDEQGEGSAQESEGGEQGGVPEQEGGEGEEEGESDQAPKETPEDKDEEEQPKEDGGEEGGGTPAQEGEEAGSEEGGEGAGEEGVEEQPKEGGGEEDESEEGQPDEGGDEEDEEKPQDGEQEETPEEADKAAEPSDDAKFGTEDDDGKRAGDLRAAKQAGKRAQDRKEPQGGEGGPLAQQENKPMSDEQDVVEDIYKSLIAEQKGTVSKLLAARRTGAKLDVMANDGKLTAWVLMMGIGFVKDTFDVFGELFGTGFFDGGLDIFLWVVLVTFLRGRGSKFIIIMPLIELIPGFGFLPVWTLTIMYAWWKDSKIRAKLAKKAKKQKKHIK